MTAAVLAVQGAFAEHEKILSEQGISCLELRKKSDVEKSFDALILPGGESTVQGKLHTLLPIFSHKSHRVLQSYPGMSCIPGML